MCLIFTSYITNKSVFNEGKALQGHIIGVASVFNHILKEF